MKVTYIVAASAIQTVLTNVFLIVWQLLIIQNFLLVLGQSSILFLLISCFAGVTSLLLGNSRPFLSVILVPLSASFLTTLAVTFYPEIGFAGFEWYILFSIMFLAGIFAHLVLYDTGARMNGVTTND